MVQARTGHTCTTQLAPGGGLEVVVAGGVAGGVVRSLLDSVEIWSSRTRSWRHGPRLPAPLFGSVMLQLSGQPVLLGGWSVNMFSMTFQHFQHWQGDGTQTIKVSTRQRRHICTR